jgi:hypothetical protein
VRRWDHRRDRADNPIGWLFLRSASSRALVTALNHVEGIVPI